MLVQQFQVQVVGPPVAICPARALASTVPIAVTVGVSNGALRFFRRLFCSI